MIRTRSRAEIKCPEFKKYPDSDCQNYMKSPQSGLGYDPETLVNK